MHAHGFDQFVKRRAASRTRRGLLRLLAVLPLGGVLGWVGSEESSAANPRQKCQKKTGEAKKRCLKKARKRKKRGGGDGGDGGGGDVCPPGSPAACCQCNTTNCSVTPGDVESDAACDAFCASKGGRQFLFGVMGGEQSTCESGQCGNALC